MMPTNRKISVSFVSEPFPINSNDLTTQGRHDPAFSALQQKLLRLQVIQVVLSLILMVLSAVAIIEEQALFSLGFGIISALICILAAVVGIQQCNPKILLVANGIALSGLIPALYFTYISLSYNLEHRALREDNQVLTTVNKDNVEHENSRTTTTIWILSWLELLHIIPLGAFLIYEFILIKYLYYYYYNL